MKLPDNIYFTGAPGSMWSSIARILEKNDGFNDTDRTESRSVKNKKILAGHEGMYFGQVDGFPASMDRSITDSAYHNNTGCKVLKSHNWAEQLDTVKDKINDDWIMMIYRHDLSCATWWNRQGGWDIDYPTYDEYRNDHYMLYKIQEQNKCMLRFASKNNLSWHYFTPKWIHNTFGIKTEFNPRAEIISALKEDTLVTVYKP